MSTTTFWFLDTNILSEMMHLNLEARVSSCLDEFARDGIGLAAITVWEVFTHT